MISGEPDLRAAILARMPDTVIAIGQLDGAAARAEELRALLREHEGRAAATPGCRRFYVGVSLHDPDHYVITQEWDDPASLAEFVYPGRGAQRRYVFSAPVGSVRSRWVATRSGSAPSARSRRAARVCHRPRSPGPRPA
jgi:Antibiotic biosynthesis monooxygenase